MKIRIVVLIFFLICYTKYGENMKKVFKTLEEQLAILKDRGLVVFDEEKAKNILLRENYFFISGYRHFFEVSKDKFIKGTTFEELYGMFIFDRKLRNIFFKNLLVIENNLKSIMSYELSQSYGVNDKEYLLPKNYTSDSMQVRQVRDVLNKINRQIRINGSKHTATYHYITNYGYVPMWILVKVLSFGLIAEYYDILKSNDQRRISDVYKLDSVTFSTYLHILSNYRNLCAHEDILYEHKTQRSIPNTRYHELLNIEMKDGEYVYGKDDMFAVIIIFKYLLTKDEFKDLINETSYEFDILDGKTNIIPTNKLLNKIGFPDNWRDIIKLD